MDLCDGNIGKIKNYLMILVFCDDFDIVYKRMRENSIIYGRILSIMTEYTKG
jgi:hypothetical protein